MENGAAARVYGFGLVLKQESQVLLDAIRTKVNHDKPWMYWSSLPLKDQWLIFVANVCCQSLLLCSQTA